MKSTTKRVSSAMSGALVAHTAATPALASTPAAAHAFVGNFDACGPRLLTGWLHDKENPRRTCEVDVRVDGVSVGRLRADSFRIDLLEQRIGDGFSGFQAAVPEVLLDGREHWVEIREATTGFLLPGGPVRFKSGTAIREQFTFDSGRIRGALRGTELAPPFEVDVVDVESQRIVATGIAQGDTRSPGVALIDIALPREVLDGRPHAFSVRTTGSTTLLGDVALITPFTVTPEAALIQYAREGMKPSMSWAAGYRYDALCSALEHAMSATHAANLPSVLSQVLGLHRRLVRGFDLRDRDFDVLTFPSHRKPDVSIVIPVHNKFAVTYHCLASLLVARNEAKFEIILVDDGSDDDTLRAPELVKGVRHLRNPEALGYLRACNRGTSMAKGRYVVMLNNDTEVTPGWLDELLWPFEHFERVGLTGGKLIYPDGALQEAGGIVWSNGNPWNYGRMANPHDPRFNYTRQVDYVSGACLMLPMDLWKKVGGFTVDYAPAYFEDTDLAFKVREAGYKTVYAPRAQVIHFEGMSSGTSVAEGIKRFQEINRPKFKQRWHEVFRTNGHEGQAVELVKDRNVRMRALVVDTQTPTPDKDAGSYAAIQEIRMLQALGFKCTFFPQNLAWMAHYTEALQRMGVEVLHAPFWTSMEQLLQERGAEFDLVYITRYHVAQQHLPLIRERAPRAKVALMLADLHFLRELRAAIHKDDAALKAQALRIRDEELAILMQVDLVLSYTEIEQAVILSHNSDRSVVERCPWVAEPVEQIAPFANRRDIAFLGGFNHKPNVEAIEWFVAEVMPLVRKRLPDVNLRVYGSNMPEALAEDLAREPNVIVEGWIADTRQAYDGCRVFVAPLQSGAGIKGKVIGALAHGVPTIMSAIAAEGISIAQEAEGFVASHPQEWIDAIKKVYAAPDAWHRVSKGAHAAARRQFGFQAGVAQIKKALQRIDLYTADDDHGLTAKV